MARKLRAWPAVAACVLAIAACTTQTNEVSRAATAGSDEGVLSTSNLGRVPQGVTGPREQRITAYLTGYSYWDNTPPGSAAIARPVIHRRAGGTGTYENPVTIAVGHRIDGRRQTLDYPEGTRFYVERLRKYAIVEDVCGDGNNPQDGPCHSGYKGHPWLDIYIGGARQTRTETNACAYRITALQDIVINPRPGYPVSSGEITAAGCEVF